MTNYFIIISLFIRIFRKYIYFDIILIFEVFNNDNSFKAYFDRKFADLIYFYTYLDVLVPGPPLKLLNRMNKFNFRPLIKSMSPWYMPSHQ
jgi:hypothetical protein